MTTKCVCQKGPQKTWDTSTFTTDCRAVKEPQSSFWRIVDDCSSGSNVKTSRMNCSPFSDVIQENAVCAFLFCSALNVISAKYVGTEGHVQLLFLENWSSQTAYQIDHEDRNMLINVV